MWPGPRLIPDLLHNLVPSSAPQAIRFADPLACVYFSIGLKFGMETAMIYCSLKPQHGRVVILFF